MDDKTSKITKSVFWALIAVLLLWFSFRGVDWAEFWRVIRTSRWGYVLLAMSAGVLSFFLRAFRWRLLLLPVEPQTRRLDCYDGVTIGRLSDFVVPHVGELVRCGYVVSPRMTYDKALGTVVLERTWDILMLLLMTVLLLVFRGDRFGEFFMEKMLEPAATRLNISLWWLLALLVALAAVAVWAIFALRHRSRFCGRAAGFFKGLGQGFSSFLHMKGKGMFLLLTVLLWTMFLLMSWFIIKAVSAYAAFTLADALFIMLVGSLASIVPVPGGFGAFHYLVALALQTVYGIPFETGLIFATLSHESQALTTVVCGLVSYSRQALRRR